MNIILIYFAIKYKGDWDAIYKALDQKERVTLKEISELEEKIKNENWNIITILDMEYPNALKTAYKPPFVLWYKGNKKLLSNNFVSFTGNQVNKQVNEWISKYVPELVKDYSLVLAGYKGVEEKIESMKLDRGKLYIAASGIDLFEEPKELDHTDLCLTEYPFGVNASQDTYRNRNRLIAAMANYLVLASSEKGGKINSLISNFLNLGKSIYCFPGDGSEIDGNSELIKQGATLITSIEDISN